LVAQEGVPFVNAARVPRHRGDTAHHVCLTVEDRSVAVDEVWVTLT
jgi:hypothetical protein